MAVVVIRLPSTVVATIRMLDMFKVLFFPENNNMLFDLTVIEVKTAFDRSEVWRWSLLKDLVDR